jgi:antirestriction protein ArdC
MEVRMKITALYESVTQSIINDLEAGAASWVKPWKDGNTGDILPMNAAAKRRLQRRQHPNPLARVHQQGILRG